MSDERGFSVIPTWLLRDRTIDVKAKMLFLLLSSRIGRDGTAWPSQERLGEELGVSARTVRRHLNTLIGLNLVVVTVTVTPTGRRNTYRLMVDRFGGADTGVLTHEDASVPRTRAIRTTTNLPGEDESGGEVVEGGADR